MAISYHYMSQAQRMSAEVKEYFKTHPENRIGLVTMMPLFVEKGIFKASRNKISLGILTIKVLEKEKRMDLLPELMFEQKEKNKRWYFVRPEALL